MADLLKEALHAPMGTLFILAGLAFLGIAVLGKISGKIEPGKGGRIASGVLGTVLLLGGIITHQQELQTHPQTDRESVPAGQEHDKGINEPSDATPKVYSSGQIVIRGTWSCDLDLGREATDGQDFWWEQVTATERYIVPRNGARFSVLGKRDADLLSYTDLTRLSYSQEKINGSDATYNRIPQGTVLAAITNEGRHSKFTIDEYGYSLKISWTTYEK